jgi:hypothetical protein
LFSESLEIGAGKMKKKLIVILIVSLVVILFVTLMTIPALAKREPPQKADGIWYYTPDFPGIQVITFTNYVGDPNKMFASVPYASTWTGIFNGPSWDYGLVVTHDPVNFPPIGVPMLFVDTASFKSVEVCGAVGDLEMDVLGDIDPKTAEWRGTWVITGGTDDLENVEGHGTFWGPGYIGGPDPGVIYYKIKHMDGVDWQRCRALASDIGPAGR